MRFRKLPETGSTSDSSSARPLCRAQPAAHARRGVPQVPLPKTVETKLCGNTLFNEMPSMLLSARGVHNVHMVHEVHFCLLCLPKGDTGGAMVLGKGCTS